MYVISLREITSANIDELVDLALISEYHRPMINKLGRRKAQEVIREVYQDKDSLEGGRRIDFGIYHRDYGLIGVQNCFFFLDTGKAETGSWILEDYQSKGYGAQARHLALDYIFGCPEIMVSVSEVVLPNPGSEKISQKLGYKLIEENRIKVEGEKKIARKYGISRKTWLSS